MVWSSGSAWWYSGTLLLRNSQNRTLPRPSYILFASSPPRRCWVDLSPMAAAGVCCSSAREDVEKLSERCSLLCPDLYDRGTTRIGLALTVISFR
ncbi:hypothetical protein BHE74_00010498 [Ensete ventricosum]|uniref:Uncharacterized protein n=1 Tax=Ensete ventricosum TaxID=4639 RepID=A0A427AAR4_ENSVE|nr:hypothetical protein B296_00025062 [Ensete ventricosum]RWW28986.1 hypothetical protein GW17_00006530 [Ensete ventricosum]RWW81135.1 hypothetical protein BHE74_00010498 [Ensete ventricosum]RZR80219.1 hypothetical protein BHM03_00006169 [Ensete ventricosum]